MRKILPDEDTDIERFIAQARAHGEDSEPDMEAGDLQYALRIVWQALTAYQQQVLLKRITAEVFGEEGNKL